MQLRSIPLLVAGVILPVAEAALRQHTLEVDSLLLVIVSKALTPV
jgi:hypothetical protein